MRNILATAGARAGGRGGGRKGPAATSFSRAQRTRTRWPFLPPADLGMKEGSTSATAETDRLCGLPASRWALWRGALCRGSMNKSFQPSSAPHHSKTVPFYDSLLSDGHTVAARGPQQQQRFRWDPAHFSVAPRPRQQHQRRVRRRARRRAPARAAASHSAASSPRGAAATRLAPRAGPAPGRLSRQHPRAARTSGMLICSRCGDICAGNSRED